MTSLESQSGGHFIQSTYLMMALLGIDPNGLVPNYEDPESGDHIVIAVPKHQVGIATEGDKYSSMQADGWFITVIPSASLKTVHEVLTQFRSLAFESQRRQSLETTKQTSKPEQVLIDEILRRGITPPDRNHRLNREDGKELTTPDMTWANLKLAFFVDGLWWHTSRDDTKIMEALADKENASAVMQTNKTRAMKDAKIRSTMQADGWTVLSCADKDLENRVSVEQQVDMIEKAMNRIRGEQAASKAFIAQTNKSESEGLSIMDLL